jgi:hypothetical protein
MQTLIYISSNDVEHPIGERQQLATARRTAGENKQGMGFHG